MKPSPAGILVPLLGLLFLCSCATENAAGPRLPAVVKMNREAGRGGWLILTLRLADGKKLPMILDTGSPIIYFDKSLAPKLGERLDTGTFWNFGVSNETASYAVPKLHLGSSQLQNSGTNVCTFDCRPLSMDAERPILGILGMDVLKHYCIQLDFGAGAVRFLDDQTADKTGWGRPFPLTDIGDGCLATAGNLTGSTNLGSVIDTGCDGDGWLVPELFRQWTNQTTTPDGLARSPNGVLDGDMYPDLDLQGIDAKLLSGDDSHITVNGIGFQVLSRNLVTFDFPQNTMYLKRTSIGALAGKERKAAAKAEGKSAIKFLKSLQKKGRLPGWSKTDEPVAKIVYYRFQHPATVTIDHLLKKNDASMYHYEIVRKPHHGAWKLEKAWRTDEQDHTIEDYPVP